jgi:hypothetical protein
MIVSVKLNIAGCFQSVNVDSYFPATQDSKDFEYVSVAGHQFSAPVYLTKGLSIAFKGYEKLIEIISVQKDELRDINNLLKNQELDSTKPESYFAPNLLKGFF